MIGLLTGTVSFNAKNPMILLVGGVGYAVSVPQRILSGVHTGETHTLFIHTHVSDDAIELFGFPDQEELRLFELLLTVSGIGPKTGLAIVERGADHVRGAIAQSDVDFFTTIPRLGKKNAQKIIIELKSALGSVRELDLAEESTGETKDVFDALSAMGFGRKEIIEVLRKLEHTDVTIEQKIRHALKLLAK